MEEVKMMKRFVLIVVLALLAVNSIAALPSAFTTWDTNVAGWMYMGLGISLSIPDGELSFLFEFEIGLPERFGAGITIMIGERTLCTLDGIYFLDPAPDSIFAIPIMLKAGLLNIDLFGESGKLDFGLALASGIRLFPLGATLPPDGGIYLTGDLEAVLYWNFHDLEFSVDVYPGIQFSLLKEYDTYHY
jgi:hypothetical protein